jgi:hypothetical protein
MSPTCWKIQTPDSLTNFIQEIIDNASTAKWTKKDANKHGQKKPENSFVSTNNIIKEYQTKKLKQIHFIDIDET